MIGMIQLKNGRQKQILGRPLKRWGWTGQNI